MRIFLKFQIPPHNMQFPILENIFFELSRKFYIKYIFCIFLLIIFQGTNKTFLKSVFFWNYYSYIFYLKRKSVMIQKKKLLWEENYTRNLLVSMWIKNCPMIGSYLEIYCCSFRNLSILYFHRLRQIVCLFQPRFR